MFYARRSEKDAKKIHSFFSNFSASMKKYLFPFLFTLFSLFCSAQQKWFSVKAFLPRWNGSEISLFAGNQIVYTGKVENDMFSYTGDIESSTEGVLKIKSGKSIFYITIFLEPGTIKIRDAGGRQLIASGTTSNDVYTELYREFDSMASQLKQKSFSELFQYKRTLATEYIRSHPSSIVSVQLLKDFFYLSTEADDYVYYSLAYSLKSFFSNSFIMAEMLKEANTRFITAIGRTAPVSVLPDTAGNTRSIYKNGEYTLIDFWASWCQPCRKENLALKKIFDKYHTIGFTITSISLDSRKLLWKNAIKQDKMTWLQLSDLKGWDGICPQVYGVKTIPMNFLINKEGVIVAKNLSPDQLDNLLKSLQDKQAF